ncbi:hypothetical protein PV11_01762 [Exophiala sideris]|uniref:Heterokaryon incompatibility domain-containing protein n=1 Tax=Exophiala sideris TaxID=1016849 RepID=A0A0D1YU50_9EURO|nr:hypothetical protein PV11_01762 [Exophiala sideris]
MDHLCTALTPQENNTSPPLAALHIPLLSIDTYDRNCAFSEYPAQCGFDKTRFLTHDFNQHKPGHTAAFLQTWLYFGLLTRVLDHGGGVRVDPADFIDRTCTPPRLTSRRLPEYLDRWARGVKVSRARDMDADLEEARGYVRCLLEARKASPLLQAAVLAVMVLGATLKNAIEVKIERFPPRSRTIVEDWGRSVLVEKELMRNGWCVSDVRRLLDTVSVPTAVVASSIRRCEVISPKRHGACSVEGCTARNIDEKTYKTKHVEDGCRCEAIPSPIEQVKQVLEKGDIPIIIVKEVAGGRGASTMELEVSSDRKTPYVALSHCWADGLGCVSGNFLPRCQIIRLNGLCNAVQPVASGGLSSLKKRFGKETSAMALWIDTLCVPREKVHRRLAISRMSATYANAKRVLILDSELLALPKMSPERDLILRMVGTGWMRRVWTMQEGALGASGLQIQLRDGLGFVDVPAAVHRLRKAARNQNLAVCLVETDATIFYEEFDLLRKAHSKSYWRDGIPAMAASLRILNGRSTTKKGDAYICLAGMMGLEPDVIKELDSTDVDQRTRKMLSKIRYLPKNIIFSPGEKLQEDGYRWACTSFWQSKFVHREDNEVGEIKEGLGLRVEFQGFKLQPLHLPPDYIVFQSVHNKVWFKATYDAAFTVPTPVGEPQKLGILCPERDVLRHGPRGVQVPAALVSIPARKKSLKEKFGEDRSAILCVYLCQVVLSTPTEADLQRKMPTGVAKRPHGTNEPPGMSIVYTPQQWYIS